MLDEGGGGDGTKGNPKVFGPSINPHTNSGANPNANPRLTFGDYGALGRYAQDAGPNSFAVGGNPNTKSSSSNTSDESKKNPATKKDNSSNKEIADFLRLSPILPQLAFPYFMINPFFGADAIYGDLGVLLIAVEAGYFFILSGDNRGDIIPFTEIGGGAGTEICVGTEIGRVDYFGPGKFNVDYLFGDRNRFSASIFPLGQGLSLGAGVSRSAGLDNGGRVYSTSVNFSFGVTMPSWAGFNFNTGTTFRQ